MSTDRPPIIIWEFERVSRFPYIHPPFALWTPLLRGIGLPPSQVIVNRTYHVQRRNNGTIKHCWNEKEHVDCESVWDGGWEIPVYDTGLHSLAEWRVLTETWRGKVVVPNKPNKIPPSLLILQKVDDGKAIFQSKLEAGEWIRQSINPNGKYVEERRLIFGPEVFHVKQRPLNWPYDAILITADGLEEKFILRGELS